MKSFFQKIGKGIASHKVVTVCVAVLLCLVVVFSCLGAFVFNRYSQGTVPGDAELKALKDAGQVYEHVVIFGVDGAGGYFDKMDSPGFDSVFKNNVLDASVTYTAISQYPTISAQNWGSMIHGVRCDKHKLTNDITGREKYTDTKYPSFFKIYAERHPDAYMASVVHWSNINYGIIEDMPQLNKIGLDDLNDGTPIIGETSEDADTRVADGAINEIKTKDPKILFIHFDSVDSAGHGFGWDKPEFKSAMKHVDGLIGKVYQACKEQGWEKNTLFVCISDHGHEKWGGHGSNNYNVRNVTFAVAGGKGNVVQGRPGHVVTQDLASVVLYALGEKQPGSWESKVPYGMFKGLK